MSVRGMQQTEPFMQPPCGINPDKKAPSRSCRDLRNAGCTPYELHVMWGFNAQQMMFAGLSAVQLAEGGVPSRDIAFCQRYTAAACREAGSTAREMMAAARPLDKLFAAGYSARDFAEAGLTGGALKSIGFSDDDVATASDMFMIMS